MANALDERVFQTFFDNDSRLVKEHEFRNTVFRGINPKNFFLLLSF